ncbi:methyltransferase domain-containing protein [Streptomyces sp. N2-109]|uniref:Methyltransferase domain-containing protein n=1 Tax=Streptomyces gossypii TaxID=2883101 RepID=A0ABT2K0T0_9ACTN|nr:class I SAM-dependent methyltransferase [Streptomyces gossypii]MCT2593753.1 methyltransferase domain-containing protein [Streptomyces gossypii]
MTMEENWRKRGSSFGQGVQQYERTRPGYPPESFRWVAGEEPRTVLDLGAGTGILTRALLADGHRVIAVEPDEEMREALSASAPSATAVAGSAENIPLEDASVDTVVVSHAYHWFDPGPAHAEIARVLRAGGVLAALWNLRDEEVPWSAELSRILADEDTGTDPETPAAIMLHGTLAALRANDPERLSGWLRNPTFGPRFGPIERGFYEHADRKTVESLIELISSRSYYLNCSPQRQKELREKIRQLALTHPDLAGREEFDLPYVTVVFKAQLLP